MSKSVRIHRCAKDKSNPYKPVSRAPFDGSGLSFEARGALAYILMKPDDWEINVADLQREGGIGRDKARGIIDELIAAGYGKRVEGRDKDGKFGGNDIHIFEAAIVEVEQITPEPQPEKPDTVNPPTDMPDTDMPAPVQPDTENPTHTNKGKELSNERTKEGTATQPAEQGKPLTPQQAMYGAICEALGWDYKIIAERDKVRVAQTVKILAKANYTVNDVRRFMVEIWFRDWRWEKRQQRPTLEELRQEIGKVHAGVPEQVPRTHTNGTSKVAGSLAAIDEYDRIKAAHGVAK